LRPTAQSAGAKGNGDRRHISAFYAAAPAAKPQSRKARTRADRSRQELAAMNDVTRSLR